MSGKTITLDHAYAVAALAVSTGAASWGRDGALVLGREVEGRLAEFGAARLGDLNGEQTTALVGFLAS